MKIIYGTFGIGRSQAAKLGKAGIKSLESLLEKAALANERRELSLRTGISEMVLLEWVKFADLLRIRGLEADHCLLLVETGVETIPDLASQASVLLYARMRGVLQKKNRTEAMPSGRQVKDWIEQARRLPALVTC